VRIRIRSTSQPRQTSLDIFWLRYESLEESDNPPDPDVLTQEIVEDLEAALEPPLPLIFMIEWIAALICLLSLSRLVVNLFIKFLEPSEQRAFLHPMLCNLIPTLHFLSRLRETPWERFVF